MGDGGAEGDDDGVGDWECSQEIMWIEIEEGGEGSVRQRVSLWVEMVAVEEQGEFPRYVRLSTCCWWLKLQFSDSDPVTHCALTLGPMHAL
jgi:hypothetical protein